MMMKFNTETGRVMYLLFFFLLTTGLIQAQTIGLQSEIVNVLPADCGSGLGAISATATGGSPPYNASVVATNGSLSNTIANVSEGQIVSFNLPVGNYFVFFADQNGTTEYCEGTTTIPQGSPIIEANTTHILCEGSGASASIETVVTCSFGTTHSFTLIAPDGSTIATNETGVFTEGIDVEGTYTVIVTDENGNSNATTVDVQILIQHSDIGLTMNDLQHDCGTGEGFVSITAFGANFTDVTYFVFNTTTGELQSNTTGEFTVTPGTYNQWFSYSIDGSTEICTWECPAGFTILSSNLGVYPIVNPTLCAASNGSIILSVTGSTDYTIAWSNGSTANPLTGLAAGNYGYTITDVATQCTLTGDATVTGSNTPLTIASVSTTDKTCPSGTGMNPNDGSAIITMQDGTGPYIVSLSPNMGDMTILQSSVELTGLGVGNYTATITDAYGCEAQTSFTIGEPEPFEVIVLSQIDPICDNNGVGSITLQFNGGPADSEIIVMGGGITVDRIITLPLSVGNNTFTYCIYPQEMCMTTFSIFIDAPSTPELSAVTVTDEVCAGVGNGSVSATIINYNGTEQATINGFPVSIANDGTISSTSMMPGNYILLVEDPSTGCTAADTFDINTTNNPLSVSLLSVIDEPCPADVETGNGVASGEILGGTAPYTIAISPSIGTSIVSNNTFNINNLVAGDYSVTITDANGCEAQTSFTIGEPAPFEIIVLSQTDPTCDNGMLGEVTIQITGGDPSSEIIVLGGGVTVGRTITLPLSVGNNNFTYCLYPIEMCMASFNIFVDTPHTPILATTVVQDEICVNANNGSFTGMVTNYVGTEIATLNGNPINIGGNGMITGINLAAGNYVLLVEEPSTGCFDTDTFNIAAGIAIEATVTGDLPCPDNSSDQNGYGNPYLGGTASVTVTSGTAPFTYLWNTGDTTAEISGIYSGTYTVTVTDANGCTTVASTTLVAPADFEIGYTITEPALCYGDSITVDFYAIGGTGGTYAYYVNGQPQGTNSSATLYPGVPTEIAICDLNYCFLRDTVIIFEQPTLLVAEAIGTDASCEFSTDGSATASANGGTAPYSYTWSNGGNTATISDLVAGTYTVTVVDANGCETSTIATVGYGNAAPDFGYNITPNACGDGATMDIFAEATTSVTINGTVLPLGTAIVELPIGDVVIEVLSAEGCYALYQDVVAGGNYPYTVNIDVQDACGAQGSVGITINGDAGTTYNVEFYGGTFDAVVAGQFIVVGENLNEGDYTLIVKSLDNCIQEFTVTVTNEVEPISMPVLEASATTCLGATDGSVTYEITGGGVGATYEYQFHNIDTTTWYPIPASGVINGLAAGEYQMLVRVTNNDSPCGMICLPFTVEQGTTNCDGSTFWIAPNPVQQGTSFSINYNLLDLPSENTYLFQILDMQGNLVGSFTPDSFGTEELTLGLAAGTYAVVLMDTSNGTVVETQQLIVY